MTEKTGASVKYQITIIGVLFFLFGFITWANSQLIPYLKLACELTYTQSLYVATAFFAAYFIMAIPSSYILKLTGFKKGMSVGLFTMGIGALLFIPAAASRNYDLFLLGLFIIGSGLALLQTAANPFVTVLGPIESAAQRISIMGICNKFAGICAVYVLGSITLSNADEIKSKLTTLAEPEKIAELNALAHRVVMPYTVIGIVLFVLGILIFFTNMPEVHEEELVPTETVNKTAGTTDFITPLLFSLLFVSIIYFFYSILSASPDTQTPNGIGDYIKLHLIPYIIVFSLIVLIIFYLVFGKSPSNTEKSSVFSYPHLLLGAIAIFFYVGVEVISYDTFAGFGEHLGFKLEVSKNFATYTGYALLAGYLFNILAIPRYISQEKTMLVMTVLSMILVVLSVVTKGYTAVVCFMLLGFSNSVMWPAIWPLAIDGLGRFTKIGSALLIMGIVGGAILPPLYGRVSELIDSKQIAYLLMIPAYLYILYYALAGHNVGKAQK